MRLLRAVLVAVAFAVVATTVAMADEDKWCVRHLKGNDTAHWVIVGSLSAAEAHRDNHGDVFFEADDPLCGTF